MPHAIPPSQRSPARDSSPVGLNRADPLVRLLRLLPVPLLVLAGLPLLLTELGLFPLHDMVGSAVPDVVYLGHAAFGLAQGHVPYRAGFMTYPDQGITFLYPPLTLLLALPPVLAGSHYYPVAFAAEVLVLVLAGSALLGGAASRSGVRAPIWLVTLVLLLAVGPVLLTRLDGVQGLLIAGSALALTRRRYRLAVASVALAVLVKETALVAAAPVLAWTLLSSGAQGRPWRQRLADVGVGILPALALAAVFAAWSGGAEVSAAFTSVHRGLEIESLAGSLAILLRPFYPAHSYIGSLASVQLAAADAGSLAATTSALGVVAVLGGAVAFARQGRHPATAVAFCVAAGLCATPVLSPQYILGLLPVLALAVCTELPRERAVPVLLLALLAALLTQAVFPYLIGQLASLSPLGVVPVVARNLVLLVLAGMLSAPLWRRRQAAPTMVPAGS